MSQPKPIPNGYPATWSLVVKDMTERNKVGIQRYGTPLQPFNGRNSLQDAYEEVLDLCVYLKNAIEEQKRNVPIVDPEMKKFWTGESDGC